jgi:hypothetical protein
VRPPRRGEVWSIDSPSQQAVLVISSTVYNEITSEPTVLVALVVEHATEEGFCVNIGQGQWAVMGLVTFVPKSSLAQHHRTVDIQTLTNANAMLFKILATPDR